MMNDIDYIITTAEYTILFIARHKKERYPIAYAGLNIIYEEGKQIGKLGGIIRRHEFKKKGIVRELVNKRLDVCKMLGCDKAYVAVYYKRKGLIKLYERQMESSKTYKSI